MLCAFHTRIPLRISNKMCFQCALMRRLIQRVVLCLLLPPFLRFLRIARLALSVLCSSRAVGRGVDADETMANSSCDPREWEVQFGGRRDIVRSSEVVSAS